jgi:GNAT superfamily N-acetyltransferase
MPSLWRLTRNRYTRLLYERLDRIGIAFATLSLYVCDCTDGEYDDGTLPQAAVTKTYRQNETDRDLSEMRSVFRELRGNDLLVVAHFDDDIAGYLFVSYDRSVFVPALEASVSFDGVYLWQLYVDPKFRQRGIATNLIYHALDAARETFKATTAIALVALDNYPSRAAFESNGFDARQTLSYLRIMGFEKRLKRTHSE